MNRPRTPLEAGYLGPEAEAQRAAELLRARLASPKRSTKPQDDPTDMALFASTQPTLF